MIKCYSFTITKKLVTRLKKFFDIDKKQKPYTLASGTLLRSKGEITVKAALHSWSNFQGMFKIAFTVYLTYPKTLSNEEGKDSGKLTEKLYTWDPAGNSVSSKKIYNRKK